MRIVGIFRFDAPVMVDSEFVTMVESAAALNQRALGLVP
jgi:hypothetical protein